MRRAGLRRIRGARRATGPCPRRRRRERPSAAPPPRCWAWTRAGWSRGRARRAPRWCSDRLRRRATRARLAHPERSLHRAPCDSRPARSRRASLARRGSRRRARSRARRGGPWPRRAGAAACPTPRGGHALRPRRAVAPRAWRAVAAPRAASPGCDRHPLPCADNRGHRSAARACGRGSLPSRRGGSRARPQGSDRAPSRGTGRVRPCGASGCR